MGAKIILSKTDFEILKYETTKHYDGCLVGDVIDILTFLHFDEGGRHDIQIANLLHNYRDETCQEAWGKIIPSLEIEGDK